MATKSEARRASLLDALRSANAPVSGGQLANTLSVSRQIIVQDIALLREAGANIVATTKGYVLADTAQTSTQSTTQTTTQNAAKQPAMRLDEPARTFKLHHEVEQTREELQTIIALGGRVHSAIHQPLAPTAASPRLWRSQTRQISSASSTISRAGNPRR